MRQPVPTLSNPNFANRDRLPPPPSPPQSLDRILSDVISDAVASGAAAQQRRTIEAIGSLLERCTDLKHEILAQKSSEMIAPFPSINGLADLPAGELAALESEFASLADRLEERARAIGRERIENMTEVERLSGVVAQQGEMIQALGQRIAMLEMAGGVRVESETVPGRRRADAPQLLTPPHGTTAAASGSGSKSGVRRIG